MTRKIVANLFLTLDGVMEAPETWQFPYFNDEMGQAVGASFARTDALLMGGTLYREFAAVWPTRDGDLADTMNGLPKYVLSRTLQHPDWNNTTVISGDDVVGQVRALKEQPGKDIAVTGSATLVNWLIDKHLLDELSLLLCPVLVGKGRPLFTGITPPQGLTLASATPFTTGVVHLVYHPALVTNGDGKPGEDS